MVQETEVLVTELRADIKKYEAALRKQVNATNKAARDTERRFNRLSKKVERDSNNIARSISRGFSGAQKAAIGLFGVLSVGSGLRLLDSVSRQSISAGDDLAKMAAAVDISVERLDALRFAAQRSGGTISGLDTGILKFTKSIGEARANTGALFTLLDRIDPGVLNELQNASSTEQALDILFERLKNSEDAFERNAIASAAFGRTAGKAFAKLSLEVDGLLSDFQKLGGGIGTELAKEAEEAEDRLTDLDVVLKNRLNVTVLENIEGFIQFKTLMNDIATGAVGFAANVGNAANALDRFFDRLPGATIRDESQVDDLLVRRERLLMKIDEQLARIGEARQRIEDSTGLGSNFLDSIDESGIEKRRNTLRELSLELLKVNKAIDEGRRRDARAAVAQADASGGAPVGGGFVDPRRLEETEKLIADIESAWRDAFETEAEGIERTRRERIEALQESVAGEQERARAIKQINETADEQLRIIRENQAQEERDFVDALVDQRDRATGRIIAATVREFDARERQINEEIQNEERRNTALQALVEERAAFEAFERANLPGSGLTDFEEQIREIATFEAEKMAVIKDAFDAQLITLAEFEARRRNIIEESESEITAFRKAMLATQLSDASGTFGALAGIVKDFAGETSSTYQALFAVQKAFAVSSAIVSTSNAVTKALESAPPPINFVNAALVAAAGAAEVATIASQGFRQGGRIVGPGGPTDDAIPALVDGRRPIAVSNGEFIVNAEATSRNLALLKAINAGRGFQGGGLAGLGAPQIAPPRLNAAAPMRPPIVNVPETSVPVTVNNFIDPVQVVNAALSTRSGQKAVLNVIQRNRSTVNADLGAGGRVS